MGDINNNSSATLDLSKAGVAMHCLTAPQLVINKNTQLLVYQL